MEQAITPGRIVYYKDAEDRILPAMVVSVNEEGAVCLQVFAMDKVYPVHIVEKGEGQGQWDWMPFQKDQQTRLAEKEVEVEPQEPVVEEVSEPETGDMQEPEPETTENDGEKIEGETTLEDVISESEESEINKTGEVLC